MPFYIQSNNVYGEGNFLKKVSFPGSILFFKDFH